MNRDVRLRGLSSEHHHALRLARSLLQAATHGALEARDVRRTRDSYDRELLPHFRVEEEVLLPALSLVGEAALVIRTWEEHQRLAAYLERAEAGHPSALEHFGALLDAHVRFEERELFPTCEAKLPSAVLDAVFRRSPRGA